MANNNNKSLLAYVTANIPNTPTQHRYKTQHSSYSDGTTHIKQDRSKGVQPTGFPCTTNHCSTRLTKAVDTINIHTLIRKLVQTNIPDTIIKFIANYIKERKAYTTYRNHTSSQRQFKTGVPQGGIISPTRVQPRNIYNHTYRKFLPGQNRI